MEYMSGFVEKRDCQLQQTSICLCRVREAFPQGGIWKGRIKRGKTFEQQYNDETFSFFFSGLRFFKHRDSHGFCGNEAVDHDAGTRKSVITDVIWMRCKYRTGNFAERVRYPRGKRDTNFSAVMQVLLKDTSHRESGSLEPCDALLCRDKANQSNSKRSCLGSISRITAD